MNTAELEQSILTSAREKLAAKQLTEAIDILTQGRAQCPQSLSLCHLAATTYLALGDPEASRRCGHDIWELAPAHPLGYHVIANSYLKITASYDYSGNQMCQQALQIAKEGYCRHPQHHGLLLTVIRAEMLLGMFNESLQHCEELLVSNPDMLGAKLYAAQSALSLRDYLTASSYASQLLVNAQTGQLAANILNEAKAGELATAIIEGCLEPIRNSSDFFISCSQMVSLGRDCLPAAFISRQGLRHAAMPFDWLVCPAETLLQTLQNDFHDFLDPALIATRQAGHSSYHLKYTNLQFPHHDLTIPDVHAAFCRRLTRFRALIKSSEPVLYVISEANFSIACEIAEYLPSTSRILSLQPEESMTMKTPRLVLADRLLHVEVAAFTSSSMLPAGWPVLRNKRIKTGGDIHCHYARTIIELTMQSFRYDRRVYI